MHWKINFEERNTAVIPFRATLPDQIKINDEIKSKRKQIPRNAAAIARIRMQDQAQEDSLKA